VGTGIIDGKLGDEITRVKTFGEKVHKRQEREQRRSRTGAWGKLLTGKKRTSHYKATPAKRRSSRKGGRKVTQPTVDEKSRGNSGGDKRERNL